MRPLVVFLSERPDPRWTFVAPGKATANTVAKSATPAASASTRFAGQRSAASTTSDTISAASDDCEKVRTRPASSTPSAALTAISRRQSRAHSCAAASMDMTIARKRP